MNLGGATIQHITIFILPELGCVGPRTILGVQRTPKKIIVSSISIQALQSGKLD